MLRDYSTTKEENLKRAAEAAEEKGWWNKTKDFANDLLMRFTISTGLLQLDGGLFDLEGDLQTYQNIVIDAQNIKKEQIEKIFERCRKEDQSRGKDLEKSKQNLEKIAAHLNSLRDMIDPSMNTLSTKSVDKLKDTIQGDMTAIHEETTKRLNADLTEIEKRLAAKAGKEALKDLAGMAIDLCSFVVDLGTGKIVDGVFDGYDFVSDTMALFSDVGALGSVGISHLFQTKTGKYTRARIETLEQADIDRQNDDLATLFHAQAGDDNDIFDKFWHTLGTTCEYIDDVKAVYETVTGITEAAENLDKLDKNVKKIKAAKKGEKIKTIIGIFKEPGKIDKKIGKIDDEIEKAKKLKSTSYKIKKIEKLKEQKKFQETLKKVNKVKKWVERVDKIIDVGSSYLEQKQMEKEGIDTGKDPAVIVGDYITGKDKVISTTEDVIKGEEGIADIYTDGYSVHEGEDNMPDGYKPSDRDLGFYEGGYENLFEYIDTHILTN